MWFFQQETRESIAWICEGLSCRPRCSGSQGWKFQAHPAHEDLRADSVLAGVGYFHYVFFFSITFSNPRGLQTCSSSLLVRPFFGTTKNYRTETLFENHCPNLLTLRPVNIISIHFTYWVFSLSSSQPFLSIGITWETSKQAGLPLSPLETVS